VLRHVGFCPVCTKDIKVRGDVLVHHGYKRPGYGFIVGGCFGVHKQPHELSPKLAQDWLAVIDGMRTRVRREVDTLPSATTLPRWPGSEHMVSKEAVHVVEWRDAYTSMERHLNRQLEELNDEAERLRDLIERWTPKPLRDVTELERDAQAARTERAGAVAEKRRARADAKLASFQKRIDWAVRRRDMDTLADLWRGAQEKIRQLDPTLSNRDAIALLDRDSVWQAFDLIDEHGEYRFDEHRYDRRTGRTEVTLDRGEAEALVRMRGGYVRVPGGGEQRVSPRAWPAALR